MNDREKVIKGLEEFISDLRPFAGNHGDWEKVENALALLKAQEPRVMTLEEVAGYVALERETPIYVEFGYMATHSGQVIGLNPKYMYFDDENGLSWDVCEGPDRGKRDGVALDEYNDIWRCWTSRPTDEQKEAKPWNAQK